MQRIQNIAHWVSQNALLIGISFLLAFIPLYPKLPLFDIIPGYIVRVRVEDFFVLGVFLMWLWQVWRGHIPWRSKISYAVLAYIAVGFLSSLSAMFITQTVPLSTVHIGKTILHYLRYIEYFSLLFIAAAAIKTRSHLKIVLGVILITVIAISFYGYGQRHWYWPVYSTMNREFSKGMRLYLTEHARVQSTFGGHYDLSAYLVVILPILQAAWFFIKRKSLKLLFGLSWLAGVWLLIMAGSRSSFGAFVIGSLAVIGLAMYLLHKPWWKRVVFSLLHGLTLLIILGYMMIQFGADMYERFLQTLEGYPTIHKTYHAANGLRIKYTGEVVDFVLGQGGSEKIAEATKVTVPKNAISTDDAQKLIDEGVLAKSDQQPRPARPSDVYEDIPDLVTVATQSADGTTSYVQVEKPRVFSEAAHQFGLSAAIRYDTLWPRALQGFYSNPVLGSGYGTLTKEAVGVFTEADSTDNNFLRTLGETGLLGFVTFYGVVALVMFRAWKLFLRTQDWLARVFAVSFIAGTLGLLANAVLIDVFAASKVAFTFWALAGIILAIDQLDGRGLLLAPPTKAKEKKSPAKKVTRGKKTKRPQFRT